MSVNLSTKSVGSFKSYMKVNLDQGISSSMYQPSKLLERKQKLKDLLIESQNKKNHEELDHNSLKFMLERLQGQQGYETSMLRELDPYFNF